MRKLSHLLMLLIVGFQLTACGNTSSKSKDSNTQTIDPDAKVEVYYFHFTRRCATCNAVEDETLKALKDLYPEMFEKGEIIFKSINLELDKNKELAEKLNISAQALLVVIGDVIKDITNTGFMYARTKPEKIKEAIREAIDPFLKKGSS